MRFSGKISTSVLALALLASGSAQANPIEALERLAEAAKAATRRALIDTAKAARDRAAAALRNNRHVRRLDQYMVESARIVQAEGAEAAALKQGIQVPKAATNAEKGAVEITPATGEANANLDASSAILDRVKTPQ